MTINKMDFVLVKNFMSQNSFSLALKVFKDQYLLYNGDVYTLTALKEEGCEIAKITEEDITFAMKDKFDEMQKL